MQILLKVWYSIYYLHAINNIYLDFQASSSQMTQNPADDSTLFELMNELQEAQNGDIPNATPDPVESNDDDDLLVFSESDITLPSNLPPPQTTPITIVLQDSSIVNQPAAIAKPPATIHPPIPNLLQHQNLQQ